MNTILTILGIISFILLFIIPIIAIIGLINPKWILRRSVSPKRWQVIKICGIPMIVCFAIALIFGNSLPENENSKSAKSTVASKSSIKQDSKNEGITSTQKENITKEEATSTQNKGITKEVKKENKQVSKTDFGCTIAEFFDNRFNEVTDMEKTFLYIPELSSKVGTKPFVVLPSYNLGSTPKLISKNKYLYHNSIGESSETRVDINVFGVGVESKKKAKVYKIESIFDIVNLEYSLSDGHPYSKVAFYILTIEGIMGSVDQTLSNDERVSMFNELGGKDIILFSKILADAEVNRKLDSIPKEFPNINKTLSKNGIRYTFTSSPKVMSLICEVEE